MPELPEVETVKRGLEIEILDKTIKSIFTSDKKLRVPYNKELAIIPVNQKIRAIKRRSKYLLLELSNKHTIVIHLGMSGSIRFGDKKHNKIEKHDHFILEFSDGMKMIFNDPRRFGLVVLIKNSEVETHKLFKDLGAEPLTKEFNGKYLKNVFENKSVAIKQALMDANNLVGVGNIYASEALFRTGINPKTSAKNIKQPKLEELSKNIKIVLEAAIKSGGSTLRDHIRSDGDMGYFQHEFKVYGRDKQPCFVCKTEIQKIVQNGRSTFFCSKCQK